MFEAAGSLAIVEPVLLLAGLVALPLLWALVTAVVARPTGRGGHTARQNAVLPMVAIGSAAGTLALAIFLGVRLALLPPGRVLVQHVSQLARLGQLDLAFDLALDARGATFAIVVAIVAFASAVHTSWSPTAGSGGNQRLVWSGIVTSGAMLFCAGDGFAPILIGLGMLSLGAWGLSRGEDRAANVAALGGNVAVLFGFVFLFWSLGGAFGPEGYDPDGAPRFVLVTTKTPSVAPDKATLSMTTYAGALVSSDDADLPGEPVVAPMSIVVPPGVYTLRVQRGAASGDVVVPRVALVAGRTHVLTPYGPTTSLRALDDQVAVPRLAPTGGTAGVRAVLSGRTVSGLRASAIVLLLVLGGALAHLHALASRRGPSALGSVLEVVAAPYLALRLTPLVEPSGADGSLVVLLGAGSAVVLAARASCVDDPYKALRGVLAASSAAAVAAAGLGDPSSVLVLACASLVAASSALAALEARRDVRWLGVGCAAAVGLLPGAGTSSGYILAIAAALGSAATGSVAWAAFSGAIAIVLATTCALGALAAFRVYDATVASAPSRGPSRVQGAVVIVLAVLSLIGGVALGAGTTAFGGSVVPLAQRLAGPAAMVATRSMAGAAVILVVVAATAGVVLARRASDASAPPGWLLALGRPYAVLAWTASGLGDAARFLERSVRAMDREVIEDIPAAIGDLLLRAARGVGRAGAGVSSKVDPPVERAALAVSAKLEMDDPRAADRIRTGIVLVMVALLGLVVLSSFLLG